MPDAEGVATYLDPVRASAEPRSKRATPPQERAAEQVPTLLYLVGRVDRVVRRAIQDALKDRGLSVNQYTTLSVLQRRGGLSNAQLARRALVSPQSMNEVLLALEERGLVRRRAHPDHGRILQSELTAKGRRVLAACDERVHSVEARMVEGLSDSEQDALRQALVRCVRMLHGGLDAD
jgi:DNA-binding MarR family transcriptional regulator